MNRPRLMILLCSLAVVLFGGLAWVVQRAWTDDRAQATATEPFWVAALAETSGDGFALPDADWRLSLPEDHGTHPNTRTESWTLAAHLETAAGDEVGVQFSLLRLGVTPPGKRVPTSAWDVDTLYRAHVILSGTSQTRAVGEERFGRGMSNIAGYDSELGELRLDNWVLDFGDSDEGAMTLTATVRDDAVLKLVMRPQKSPLSTEAEGEGAPIAGYGITRFSVDGTLEDRSGAISLTGTAWFDHIWGQLPLPGSSPISYDRLQVQLEDGTDLSLTRSRRRDGRGAPIVDGFAVLPDLTISSLNEEDVRMTPSRSWTEPGSGTPYPVAWELSGSGLDLTIEPVIDAQAFAFAVPIWSGLVRVSGTRDGEPVTGLGTMQLTGYAEP